MGRISFLPPLGKSLDIIETQLMVCHWSVQVALLETARGRENNADHNTLFHL